MPSSAATRAKAIAPTTAKVAFSPLYRQIKALILEDLRRGQWQPGCAIPSEMKLAARFGVSQGTVRKAIDELTQENLLLRRQGKGTFAATHAEQKVRFRFLRLVAIEGDASQATVKRHIIFCRPSQVSPAVAQALALTPSSAVLHIRRVLSFADSAVILEDIWLPAADFQGLDAALLNSYEGPLYALFESRFQLRMLRAEEKICAVAANTTQAQLLDIEAGTPLLRVDRLAYTYQNKPMEMRCGHYRTDRHYYRNDIS